MHISPDVRNAIHPADRILEINGAPIRTLQVEEVSRVLFWSLLLPCLPTSFLFPDTVLPPYIQCVYTASTCADRKNKHEGKLCLPAGEENVTDGNAARIQSWFCGIQTWREVIRKVYGCDRGLRGCEGFPMYCCEMHSSDPFRGTANTQ